MKYLSLLLSIVLFSNYTNEPSSTYASDNNLSPYPRVRQAYGEKIDKLNDLLAEKQIDTSSIHIFLRAFKKEKVLELWAKNAENKAYQLLSSYPICVRPGDLGPKRAEGDYQVPEGFCPFFLI